MTNVAFKAFPCFDFEEGDSFLIAYVKIMCRANEHRQAKGLAIIAILLYPMGLFVLTSLLLFASRKAMLRTWILAMILAITTILPVPSVLTLTLVIVYQAPALCTLE